MSKINVPLAAEDANPWAPALVVPPLGSGRAPAVARTPAEAGTTSAVCVKRNACIPLITMLAIAICAQTASAQRARLSASRGPYYVNQPVQVQLMVTGFEDESEPDVEFPSDIDERLQLELVGVSPQSSSSTVIINGRVSRSRSVSFVFTYRLTASQPGTYEVGPFKAVQGDQEVTSGVGKLEFEEIPTDANMTVEFQLPDREFYIGERIPASIRWSYSGDVQRLGNLSVQAPILERFETNVVTEGNQQGAISLITARGEARLPATATSTGSGSDEKLVYEAPLELRATQVGDFEFEPVSATVQVVTEWARDPFGEIFGGMGRMGTRRASKYKLVRAESEPISVSIRPLPEENQPESFAGAVGEQYGIEVEANRTVVRVDDPISLTVTLLGDSYLKTAQLPDLSADGGMSPDQFMLPAERPSGTYRDGRRQFDVTVRVIDESVSEIPALAYSWFNPVTKKYETARSNPIAMRVLPAQVISSDNVVSAHPSADGATRSSDRNGDQQVGRSGDTDVRGGLNLSIEEDAQKLVTSSRSRGQWLTSVAYLLGVSALVWAVVDRRRAVVGARGGNLRRELDNHVRRIAEAANRPLREAATEVADALRALLPHANENDRAVAEQLVGRCETILFAPSGEAHSLDAELISEAHSVAEMIVANPSSPGAS